MKIIEVDNKKYILIGRVLANTNESYDELKKRYGADVILRNKNYLHLGEEIIDVEFEEI
tara:strand:+ start:372 stop:548 length:177 start_codon:yes stop_codon:yes gene_type:complete